MKKQINKSYIYATEFISASSINKVNRVICILVFSKFQCMCEVELS